MRLSSSENGAAGPRFKTLRAVEALENSTKCMEYAGPPAPWIGGFALRRFAVG